MELLEEFKERSGAEISEEEISALVARAQATDPEAFSAAFRMLQSRLHRQALFLTGNEHQAVDLLQETMLEAWKHLPRYDGRARFFTWLCRIMAHRHYDWLRRFRARATKLFSGTEEDLESVEERAATPIDLAEAKDRARVMRECLDSLPARQRTVIYLRFYAGEKLEGIAALTQCSVGTVKSRLFHALERLARMEKLKQIRKELL